MYKFRRYIFFIFSCALLFFASINIPEKHADGETGAAPRTPEEEQTIQLYKATNETVVFISTQTVAPMDIFGFSSERQEGSGSGVVVDAKKGIIITNFHVIQNADQIEVSLANGGVYAAKLVGLDPEDDLAVIKLAEPVEGLKQIELGDSASLEVGQRVIAIGNPFGLNRTLTTGIISSLNRSLRGPGGHLIKGLIQTDAAINPGNSGGPLLDTAGRLIGINTAILSRSGDSAGIGFAIPVNQIKRVLPELIATGKVLRPDLGWILVDTDQGPMVQMVLEESPAAAAGVRAIYSYRQVARGLYARVRDLSSADLIFSVNGVRVYNKDDVEDIIQKAPPGEELLFEFRRGNIKGPSSRRKIAPRLR